MPSSEIIDEQSVAPRENSTQQAGEFFDQYAHTWDAFYTDKAEQSRAFDFINRQTQLLKLVETLAPPQSRILEFGCGAGHTAVRMAQAGHQLVCVDVSNEMIEAARSSFTRAGKAAEFQIGQLSDIAPGDANQFDAVVGMGVMEYIDNHDAALREIHRLLKPGGVCLLSFPNALSTLRQVERLAKRTGALMLGILTRSNRYWDIALRPSQLHSPGAVRRRLSTAQLDEVACRYLTYGVRAGGFWLPPLRLVRALDDRLAKSPLRWLGRNYILAARKPQ